MFKLINSLKKRNGVFLVMALVLALLWQGCGKVGDPMPSTKPDKMQNFRMVDKELMNARFSLC
jgi:PBP1b-binding outer membrane lipoprotein LpoB